MITPVILFPEPIGYASASALQDRLVTARIEGRIEDVILLLEHDPVITLGRRGRDQHLLADPDSLRSLGIDLAVASRGGDVTYHGPGQLILYPILKLDPQVVGTHAYLDQLESIAIGTARSFNVEAYRRPRKSGAWTDHGKIAAIGFRLKRWVSQHGMSFNVNPDLDGFQLIVPCGLAGEPVSSLQEILGTDCPPMAQVAHTMINHIAHTFRRDLTVMRSPEEVTHPALQDLLTAPP